MNGDLQNLRCILVVRCSADHQTDVSIEKQIEMGRIFVESNNMVLVDIKEFPGFSASLGMHYDGLYQLIDRKKNLNDFNSLLFMSYDRFCRGGTSEGNRIADDFDGAGIKIVTIREGLIEGDMTWLVRGMYLHQANKYVVDMSFHVCAGWENSLEAKRITHCSRSPYGVDKLFIDCNNRPLYVVREMPDFSRHRLNPDTSEVIEVIPRGRIGPVRQSSERIVFVKGDPKSVNVVRQIFRRHFIDGWGWSRIAKEVNSQGTGTKHGRKWLPSTIMAILRNPIYIGYGLANTKIHGVYHCRNTGKPILHRQKRKREMRKDGFGMCMQVTPVPRPKEDWLKIAQPLLEDYLDVDLRELVVQRHKESELGTKVAARPRKSGGDRHLESPYLLKHVLRCRNFDYRMYTITSGKYRYYLPSNHHMCDPLKGTKTVYRLNAPLAEATVLAVLKEVLPIEAVLRDRITSFIKRSQQDSIEARAQIMTLEAEQAEVVAVLGEICSLGPRSREAVQDRKQQCELRLEEIDRRLRKIRGATTTTIEATEEIIKVVLGQINELLVAKGKMPVQHLRRLIEIFIPKMEFDCYTNDLEIEVALPGWAISKEQIIKRELCVVRGWTSECMHQAQYENGLILATFHGKASPHGRSSTILELFPELAGTPLPSFTASKNGQKIAVAWPAEASVSGLPARGRSVVRVPADK